MLRSDLQVDKHFSSMRGGEISVAVQLYVTLRYLAGASYQDIFIYTGMSIASLYRVVWKVCAAINKHPTLAITFPTTVDECAEAAAGFESISFKSAINNCVGCIDGLLVKINTPPKKDAGNVRSFFSGHYKAYGVNCQAVCDHQCRFIYFGVVAPGVTNDRDAIASSSISTKIESLPAPFVVIGDAAYTPTEHLVPCYYGNDLKKAKYDSFTFYASQLRIRIEMAFGLLTQKWRILACPLRVKLSHVKDVVLTCARLHNYVINERLQKSSHIGYSRCHVDMESSPRAPCLSSSINAESAAQVNNDMSETTNIQQPTCFGDIIPGYSFQRELMVTRVADKGLRRPVANRIIRRSQAQGN